MQNQKNKEKSKFKKYIVYNLCNDLHTLKAQLLYP